jgi:hypothetical protein
VYISGTIAKPLFYKSKFRRNEGISVAMLIESSANFTLCDFESNFDKSSNGVTGLYAIFSVLYLHNNTMSNHDGVAGCFASIKDTTTMIDYGSTYKSTNCIGSHFTIFDSKAIMHETIIDSITIKQNGIFDLYAGELEMNDVIVNNFNGTAFSIANAKRVTLDGVRITNGKFSPETRALKVTSTEQITVKASYFGSIFGFRGAGILITEMP